LVSELELELEQVKDLVPVQVKDLVPEPEQVFRP
jgi:hypothetical protein